jgi:hypothetical protein
MLTAYYDLAFSPPTYDIVAFLSAAEIERRKGGDANPMQVVILPGPKDGFRNDRFWPFSISMREQMRDRVAAPMCNMMPCTSVKIAEFRPKVPNPGSIGFAQSLYGLRVHVDALRRGIRPLRAPLTLRTKPKQVTITLRESEHWPERNSNANAWLEAALEIRLRGYDVMVVRDSARADAQFGDFATSPPASRDLEKRAQLYGSSACNLFVNNGPAWFALALDAPVLMLKPTVEGLMRTCSAGYFRECGIEPGGQIPGSPKYQRIEWAEDRADAIVTGFERFMSAQVVLGSINAESPFHR